MVTKKLSKCGQFKKKLSKKTIEILRNIELLVFLNKNKIKKFQDIILKEINKTKDLSKFTNYLKRYIFKLINNGFNYIKIIKEKYENGNSNSLEKLYLTNNVVESINSKINFMYLKELLIIVIL